MISRYRKALLLKIIKIIKNLMAELVGKIVGLDKRLKERISWIVKPKSAPAVIYVPPEIRKKLKFKVFRVVIEPIE